MATVKECDYCNRTRRAPKSQLEHLSGVGKVKIIETYLPTLSNDPVDLCSDCLGNLRVVLHNWWKQRHNDV